MSARSWSISAASIPESRTESTNASNDSSLVPTWNCSPANLAPAGRLGAVSGPNSIGARHDPALPTRRASQLFDFQSMDMHFTASVSRYPDGRIAELFIDNHKAGSGIGTLVRDLA